MTPSPRSGDPSGGPRWLEASDEQTVRRPPLTRRRIVEVAMALVDEIGLQGLTIRRIAAELGVSPMAIYSHIADKAELIDLFVDQVVGESYVEVDPDDEWSEQVRAICRGYREGWGRHPGVAQAFTAAAGSSSPTSVGPHATAQIEQVLGVLAGAGFGPEGQARAFRVLYVFMRGALIAQPTRMHSLGAETTDSPSSGAPSRDAPSRDAADRRGGTEQFLGSVDPASVPHLIAAAPYFSVDDGFDYGLEVILAGLAAQLALEA
jgi:TetR/AcrR family tetracycline transcriptional repressor